MYRVQLVHFVLGNSGGRPSATDPIAVCRGQKQSSLVVEVSEPRVGESKVGVLRDLLLEGWCMGGGARPTVPIAVVCKSLCQSL